MNQEVRNLIREAIDALKSGDADRALLTLERTVDPKFRSRQHANGAYLMRDPDGTSGSLSDFFAEGLGHQVAA